MEKTARIYLSRRQDYAHATDCLMLLILFSIVNIGIYYLTLVPVVGTIMDYLGWTGYLAPAASGPRMLFLMYANKGNWLWGALYALVALLPFVFSLLFSGALARKKRIFRGWSFLPAIIWYGVDTAWHLCSVVIILINQFSIAIIFWEIIGLLLRVIVFCVLGAGVGAPKDMRKQKDILMVQCLAAYAAVAGIEATRQLSKEQIYELTDKYINAVDRKVYNEDLDRIVETLQQT